jgi:hypothetical protein
VKTMDPFLISNSRQYYASVLSGAARFLRRSRRTYFMNYFPFFIIALRLRSLFPLVAPLKANLNK